MRLLDSSGASGTVQERLAAGRARLTLKRGAEGASWALLAAIGVLGVLKLATYLAPRIGFLPDISSGILWGAASAVLATGLLITAVRVRRTRPTLLAVARCADRQFDLDERLSTAIEYGLVEGPAAAHSPVLQALFEDAASRAPQVNPKVLVPLSAPRAACALPVLAVAVVALELAPPLSRPAVAAAAAPAAIAGDPAETARLIEETAELLQRAAAAGSNEYLHAVATSLQRLAGEVGEQRSTGPITAAELARLLAHAELALQTGEASGATLGSMTTELEEMPERDDLNVAREAASQTGSQENQNPPIQTRAIEEALEALRGRLQGEATQLGFASTPPDGDQMHGQNMPIEMAPARAVPEMPSQPHEGYFDRRAAGEPGVGEAATPTGVPESASAGAPGIGRPAARPEQTAVRDLNSSREFSLPTTEGSRRRLPVEIIPETRFSEVSEVPVPQGGWRQSPEERVASEYLGISYRDVISRYFLSLTQEPADQAP